MTKLPIYQIDAFADRPFSGNPAAVCALQDWLPDTVLQAIAEENNLSETAFFVMEQGDYHIRWFTPQLEVDLCGHATLAAAHVLFTKLGYDKDEISFESRSGVLTVKQSGQRLELNFPAQKCASVDTPSALRDGLQVEPVECLFNQDYVAVLSDEAQLKALQPDLTLLGSLDARGIIVTAPSEEYDFVCRFFGPAVGINEDAVTGSAFTKLVPYWAARTSQQQFYARQVSARGGDVWCALEGDRVTIAGTCFDYMQGEIQLG